MCHFMHSAPGNLPRDVRSGPSLCRTQHLLRQGLNTGITVESWCIAESSELCVRVIFFFRRRKVGDSDVWRGGDRFRHVRGLWRVRVSLIVIEKDAYMVICS